MVVGRKVEINGQIYTQSLKDHIDGVVSRIKSYNQIPEFEPIMEFIALSHDRGKAKSTWQDYLCNHGKQVSHSKTGMVWAEDLWKELFKDKKSNIYQRFIRDMMAYVIGAHHGIFDCLNPDTKQNNIDTKIRSEREEPDLEDINLQYEEMFKEYDFLKLYQEAINRGSKKLAVHGDKKSILFQIGLITRIWLSQLIDADWSDAAAFTYSVEDRYENYLKDFSWDYLIENLENYIENNFRQDSEVNRLRSRISQECLESSRREPGIYKLKVPTGGGKTLAAMRFALHHAKRYQKQRIFYLSPFISILEQNADTYQEVLLDKDHEKLCLEFHSNIMAKQTPEKEEQDEEIIKYLGENFASPLVLTTMVQFLNALFSDNKQSLRRLHRFQNAVVIIDEIQAVPLHCQSLLNLAINTLSRQFNTTFVICSATIPEVEMEMDKIANVVPIDYAKKADLTKNYSKETPFDRVKVVNKTGEKPYNKIQAVDFLMELSTRHPSILMVVNTRNAAKEIYLELMKRNPEITCYHLSNDMCPNHRLKTIKQIKEHTIEEPFIIISTTLIEAGVDLSVSAVLRSLSKLDNIIQAMGRCNRHNELTDKGILYLIRLDEKLENIEGLKYLLKGRNTTKTLLRLFEKRPQDYDNNIVGEEMMEAFYREYYENIERVTHYPLEGNDSMTLFELLSENEAVIKSIEKANNISKLTLTRTLNQAFLWAGREFKAIDDNSINILVPFGEGKQMIADLLSTSTEINKVYSLLRKAQQFSINIYQNELDQLIREGGIITLADYDIHILKEGFYDPQIGLNIEYRTFNNIIL